MAEQLIYGDGRSLRLAWRHPIDVLWCAAPRIAPVADARAAARRAVEAPVDYPPLSALLTPEDRVAIAVEPGVPEAASIVQGVVESLLASGTQRGQIAVVRAAAESLGCGVREVQHRADDPDSLAYLAATDDAYPIYLNRVLYDADVVVPIGLRRPNHSYGYLGAPGGIYPLFADAAAQFRLLATGPADWRRHGRTRRWEADRVAWQLGVQFRIEAVPAAHGRLAQVIGGHTDSVTRIARRAMLDAWAQRLSQPVGFAVAAIEQPSSALRWGDIQRAFYAASRMVADEGVIVVCSNVDSPPPSVRRPANAVEAGAATKSRRSTAVGRGQEIDPVREMLAELGESRRLYLLSDLPRDVVEELGCVPVETADEIALLARPFDTGLVIANAEYAHLSLAHEEGSQS
ncbi:MAG: lactate racemase domain-containing protein [Planctomycetota bacterium]